MAYFGFDEDPEFTLPRWAAKAGGTIPRFDRNGKQICMSDFAANMEACENADGTGFLVKLKSDLATAKTRLAEQGFSL